ncbi:hypothetical protein G6M26_06115 [Agrobacterium tumefaciens]|nr:hypothetical protein [Agrobacterium tumefaciens]NTE18091.1 hypothetical protein [Agrobacterium tumefaciens]
MALFIGTEEANGGKRLLEFQEYLAQKATVQEVERLGAQVAERTGQHVVAKELVEGLLNSEGKFIDNILENDYVKYLERKRVQGKSPRERLEWKEIRDYWLNDSPMARGNAFNDKAIRERWYRYNEVTLANGKRVDSYTPPANGKTGEIISRKATNLEEIELSTFESYLKEMKTKYPSGQPINAPKYGDELKGKVLEGNQILEIPVSNQNFNKLQEYINLAKNKYNIEIRFRSE